MIAKLAKWIPAACVIAAMIAALPGCPPKHPPFNASGDYEGLWSGTIENKTLVIDNCPLAMSLFQLADAPIGQFFVVGTSQIDWSCLLPPEVVTLLNLDAQSSVTVPLVAVMDDDGALAFEAEFTSENVPPQLEAWLALQGGGENPLQDFSFVLDSQGTDGDGDGIMDGLAGSLALDASYMDNGALKTLTVDGTFSIQRAAV